MELLQASWGTTKALRSSRRCIQQQDCSHKDLRNALAPETRFAWSAISRALPTQQVIRRVALAGRRSPGLSCRLSQGQSCLLVNRPAQEQQQVLPKCREARARVRERVRVSMTCENSITLPRARNAPVRIPYRSPRGAPHAAIRRASPPASEHVNLRDF